MYKSIFFFILHGQWKGNLFKSTGKSNIESPLQSGDVAEVTCSEDRIKEDWEHSGNQ